MTELYALVSSYDVTDTCYQSLDFDEMSSRIIDIKIYCSCDYKAMDVVNVPHDFGRFNFPVIILTAVVLVSNVFWCRVRVAIQFN